MRKEDHQLVQRVLDGEMSREEFDAFQNRMRNEEGMLDFYQDYARLHHTLHEEFHSGHNMGDYGGAVGKPVWRFLWYAVAAAVVVALVVLWRVRPWEGRDPGDSAGVAVGTFSLDAVWSAEGSFRRKEGWTGFRRDGTVDLEKGQGMFTMNSQASLCLDGPARVKLVDGDAVDLESGSMYCACGMSPIGTRVKTPMGELALVGGEYGIVADSPGGGEIHVFDGSARWTREGESTMGLQAGEAVRVGMGGEVIRIPVDRGKFANQLGRFRILCRGDLERSQMEIEYGSPQVMGPRVDGENYSVYYHLPDYGTDGGKHGVFLLTADVGTPGKGSFHTDGWAGISLFQGDEELAFFGDSYGARKSWSLDVRHGNPVVYPEVGLAGPAEVSLRYDPANGDISLHEGGVPLGRVLCQGKIRSGAKIDRLRIGASAGAAMALKSFVARVEED